MVNQFLLRLLGACGRGDADDDTNGDTGTLTSLETQNAFYEEDDIDPPCVVANNTGVDIVAFPDKFGRTWVTRQEDYDFLF